MKIRKTLPAFNLAGNYHAIFVVYLPLTGNKANKYSFDQILTAWKSPAYIFGLQKAASHEAVID